MPQSIKQKFDWGGRFDPLLGWRGCRKGLGIERLSVLLTITIICKSRYSVHVSKTFSLNFLIPKYTIIYRQTPSRSRIMKHESAPLNRSPLSRLPWNRMLYLGWVGNFNRSKHISPRRCRWERISPRPSEFYRHPLFEKCLKGHVRTFPGNMHVKFEVRSFHRFGAVST